VLPPSDQKDAPDGPWHARGTRKRFVHRPLGLAGCGRSIELGAVVELDAHAFGRRGGDAQAERGREGDERVERGCVEGLPASLTQPPSGARGRRADRRIVRNA
jgi:hypothetical protein